ncbi:putative mitochondrial hypothetical protein [Leptomonas pyrrhocoris]|uniref:tRNA/rRNA methyltransferase SpoU type domain-containing protein n=1 Tax=Leptomonas pyrrhocoris TaxID=157538 RepID=A0A0M9FZN0_LEPPY|nr:putative mitochondrial hypothetical protein [Leptomonas pyrrhocoris]KPA79253.1 putative mitochondrial hypothetical protein [Leptomonas pyrrhocoris]|eukprot:XP_015657692.1 putative mitochondrial hypothetical protein [Leptomonas pyrrhocoris]
MRAFTRGLLRNASRRPSFTTSASPSTHRPGTQVGKRRAYQANGVENVAEAQVIFSTASSAHANQSSTTSTPSEAEDLHLQRRPVPSPTSHFQLSKPVVLEDVQDSYSLSPTQQLHGQKLWTGTKVLRSNRHLRHSNAACVVGGANAIRRVWRTYRIKPTVVYVPNTEPEVPAWCLEEDLPTVIVRCSPVAVRRQLLSAEYSDGFAAEFPLPVNTVSDATSLLTAATVSEKAPETAAQTDRPLHNPFGHHAVKAMLVLVGLRIPSNVGALLRAATEMGYDAAVLVNCADVTQEKVLRASDGAALSPALRIYATDTTEQACVSLLSSIAAQHHLMPFLAVPSQEVDPAFEVAKRFHVYNNNNSSDRAEAAGVGSSLSDAAIAGLQAPTPPRLGPMVVLGSEAQGLRDLHGTWSVPYQLVTLPLPNPMVDSYNVSVAGSVLLHLFRPAAAEHFDRLVALSGETVADLLPAAVETEEEGEEAEEDIAEEPESHQVG